MTFKAIEVEAASGQRTGREYTLDVASRQAAVEALLGMLGKTSADAQVEPSRTLVQVDAALWTIVDASATALRESSSLRRAGAKHKRVR
ncbi:MAG: hypothetical protein E6I75_25480 [Chloroflexi bacterium]|nr:MAG: hypothetical protein E6I75_25480 [Chloroflexota bacterium]